MNLPNRQHARVQLRPDMDQPLVSFFEAHVPGIASRTFEVIALARDVGPETIAYLIDEGEGASRLVPLLWGEDERPLPFGPLSEAKIWVRKVMKARRGRRPYIGLSALDGRGDVYLGSAPQAGIGRTVGAQVQRPLDWLASPSWAIERRFDCMGPTRCILRATGSTPSQPGVTNPRFGHPIDAEG